MTRSIADLYRRATRRWSAPNPPRPARRLTFDSLETRLCPVLGAFDIPAAVQAGSDYDAVARLAAGTATLLPDFRHVLTVEHVGAQNPVGSSPAFRLLNAQGNSVAITTPALSRTAEPSGEDLAVIALAELAPLTLSPFDVFTGRNEVGEVVTQTGYGRTGTGTTGLIPVASDGTNFAEVKRLRVTGTPTAGTYTLSLAGRPGQVTLAFDATRAQIESAIQLLPGVFNATVFQVQSSPSHPYTGSFEITFEGTTYPNADVPDMLVTSTVRGGAVGVDEMIDGGTARQKRLIRNAVASTAEVNGRPRLWFDFDNGSAAADTFGDGTGRGAAEGMGAPSDSGSPVLINGKIAGLHKSPQLNGLDGVANTRDFGELSVSVRVSSYRDFVADQLDNAFDLVLNMNSQPWGNDGVPDDVRVNAAGGVTRISINGVLRYQQDSALIRSVRVQGSGDAETISVERLGAFVPVTVNAGGGNDTIRVVGVSPGAPLLANGEGGDDLIAVGAGFLDLRTNVSGDLSLDGGGGNDRLEFRDQNGAGGGVEYTLDGPLFDHSEMLDPVYYAGFDSVGVFTGKQSAGVTFLGSTAPAVDLTGGPAGDHFQIGDWRVSLGSTDVHISGGGGADELRVSDAKAFAGRTHVLSQNTYSVADQPGTVTFESVGDLYLFAGKYADTVALKSSPVGTKVTLSGNGGNDTFVLGTGDLDRIEESVVIYGGTGTDALTLDDQSEAVNTTYELFGLGVKRGNFSVSVLGTDSTTLNSSAADNAYLVRGTPGLTTINAGKGNDLIHLSPDDRDLDTLSRGLIVNGQGGSDLLVADDRSYAGSAPYTLTGSTLTRAGFPGVRFSGLETVWLRLSDDKNTVNVQGSKPGTGVRIGGNGGNDVFRTTDEPRSEIFIAGGSGFDRVIWSPWLLPPGHPNSGFDSLDLHGVEVVELPLGG